MAFQLHQIKVVKRLSDDDIDIELNEYERDVLKRLGLLNLGRIRFDYNIHPDGRIKVVIL